MRVLSSGQEHVMTLPSVMEQMSEHPPLFCKKIVIWQLVLALLLLFIEINKLINQLYFIRNIEWLIIF